MLRRRSRAVWTLAAAAWALLVWWLLTFRLPAALPVAVDWLPTTLLPWQDKLAHAGLFFVQALLVERAAVERLLPGRAFLLAIAVCAALGAATELRQRHVAGRDADAGDFAADVIGALAAAVTRSLRARGGMRRLGGGAPCP
jgi:VanZ family protein